MNTSVVHSAGLRLLTVVLFGAARLSADTLTLPGSLAATEGNTTAFWGSFFGSNTTQIQVAALELGTLGLMPGHTLLGLRFRLAGGAGSNASDVPISDLEILVGQAVNSVSGMSTTFANNVTGGVLVYDGAYTFAANSLPGGATPNAFGPAIPFSTGYLYLGGDLIVQIRRQPALVNLNFDASSNHSGAGTQYRALTGNFTSVTGTLTDTLPVIQLDYAVPEPAAATYVWLGLAGMGGWFWRKRAFPGTRS